MTLREGSIYALSIGLAVGVGIQTVLSLSFTAWLIVSCSAVLCAYLARIVTVPGRCTLLQLVALALVMSVLGAWRMDYVHEQHHSHARIGLDHSEVQLSGLVVREPEIRPTSLQVHIELEDTRVLLIVDRHADIRYGDILSVTGRLQEPEAFAAELGRTFPYPGYLAARGITHSMFFPDVTVVERDAGNPFIAFLLDQKAQFMQRIEAMIPEPQVGLAEGLLLGVRRAMSDDTLAAFRTTGIIHIVVLSGFNVMLVVAFVRYLFGYVLSLRARAIASIIAITCFALIVGLTATVVRASIMAALLLVAQFLGRTYEAMRGLFIAGAVMIVLNPYLLVYDIGFQLSFVATFGLILVAPHLEIMFATVPARVGARGYVVATIATQIAVMPLLLYHVGEFSVVSPVVNLLILPLVPIAMLLTFISGMVALLWPSFAQLIGFGAYLSLGYILLIAEWFATLPFAAFWIPAFSFIWVPIGYLGLWWLYRWYVRWSERRVRPTPAATACDEFDLSEWTILTAAEFSERQAHTKEKSHRTDDTPIFFRS